MPALILRQTAAALPPAPRAALTEGAGARFTPVRRIGMLPSLLAAAAFGAPSLALLYGCMWLFWTVRPGVVWGVLLIYLALGCVAVLGAQVLRINATVRAIRAQKARLTGNEGLYRAPDWLMLVRGAEDVSWLARGSIAELSAVRIRYLRGRDSFCATYPYAILHDGREVLLRTPVLDTDETLAELLDGWEVPIRPHRIDVTDRQLERFLHF